MTTKAQNTIPRLETPLVNPDGTVSIPWYYFLIQTFKNAGGSSPGSIVSYLIQNNLGGFDIINASTGAKIGSVSNTDGPGAPIVPIPLTSNPFVYTVSTAGHVTVDSGMVELSRDGTNYYPVSLVGGEFVLRNGDSVRISWFSGFVPTANWWSDGN